MSDTTSSLVFGVRTNEALQSLLKLSAELKSFKSTLAEFNKVKAENPIANMPRDAQESLKKTADLLKTDGKKVMKDSGEEVGRMFAGSFSVALSDGTRLAFKSTGTDIKNLGTLVSGVGTEMKQTLASAGMVTADSLKEANRQARATVSQFEALSKEARATASSVKAAMGAFTSSPAREGGLSEYYRTLQNIDQAVLRIKAAEQGWAAQSSARTRDAIAGLTKENTELEKLNRHYATLQAQSQLDSFRAQNPGMAATRTRLRNAIGTLTASPATDAGLSEHYRKLEQADRAMRSVTQAEREWTATSANRVMQAVAGLTAQNTTLASMREHYQRLESAQNAGSDSTHRFTESQKMLHSALRGVSGALGYLWLTYGRYIPQMVAGFAAVTAAKQSITSGLELGYQTKFIEVLGSSLSQPALIQGIREQAQVTGRDYLELASSLRVLQQTGVDAASGLGMLKTAVAASVLGETDMKTATEDLVGVLEVFDMHSEIPSKLAENFQKAGDMMAWIAQETKANLHDVATALQNAVGIADAYNVSLDKAAAVVVRLGKAGIVGPKAGTYFRTMTENVFTAKSDRAQQWFDEQGLSGIDKATGKYKELDKYLVEIFNKLNNFDLESQGKIAKDILDRWGRRPFEQLHKDYNELVNRLGKGEAAEAFYKQFNKGADESKNLLMSQYDKLITDQKKQWEILGKDVKNMLTDAYVAFAPLVTLSLDFLTALKEAAKWIGQSYIGAALLKGPFYGVALAVAAVLDGVTAITAAVLKLGGSIIDKVLSPFEMFASGVEWVLNAIGKTQAASPFKAWKEDVQAMQAAARSWGDGALDKLASNSFTSRVLKSIADANADGKVPEAVSKLAESGGNPTVQGGSTYDPKAKRGAKDLISAEMAAIRQKWESKVKEEENGFNRYREILDQRVKYGTLSQGAANVMLEQYEDHVRRATEESLNFERAALQALKPVDEAQRTRIQTRLREIDVLQRENAEKNAHTLLMRKEREESEKLNAVRELQKQISKVDSDEGAARRKAQLDAMKDRMDPVTLAGVTAYEQVQERHRDTLRKLSDEADIQQQVFNDLQSEVQNHEYVTLEDVQALLKQSEALQLAKDRVNELKAAIEGQAAISKADAEARAAEARTFEYGWSRAFDVYVNNATNAAQHARDIFNTSTKAMEDALVKFTKTGKLEWKELGRTIIDEMIRIEARKAASSILSFGKDILGSIFGGGGGGPGIDVMEGGGFGVETLVAAKGHAFGSAGRIQAFAKGDAFTNAIYSSPTLFRFAQGGAFNLGVMGEAGDEAVMPLARDSQGRLGVRAQGGGGGGGDVYQVSIHVHTETGKTETTGDTSNKGADLGRMIESAVRKVIIDEKRPNGLLERA